MTLSNYAGNYDLAVDGIRNINGRNFKEIRIVKDTGEEKSYYITIDDYKNFSRPIIMQIFQRKEGSIVNIVGNKIYDVLL